MYPGATAHSRENRQNGVGATLFLARAPATIYVSPGMPALPYRRQTVFIKRPHGYENNWNKVVPTPKLRAIHRLSL